MKQIEQHLNEPIQIAVVAEERKHSETKFILDLKPGQQVFEIYMKELKIRQMDRKEYINKESVATMDGGVHHKLKMRHGCCYVPATNKINAIKKYFKLLGQNKIKYIQPLAQPEQHQASS